MRPFDSNSDDLTRTKTARKVTLGRVHRVVDAAQRAAGIYSNVNHVEIHTEGYSEPDYKNPEIGFIATGNWNPDKQPEEGLVRTNRDVLPVRLGRILEKMGVELEWEDEWASCTFCNGLVRNQPNSYGWRPSYIVFSGETVCLKCLNDEESTEFLKEYLETLEGNDRQCLQIESVDLSRFDFERLDITLRNGLHEGMNDHPKVIGAALRKAGVTRYIFRQDLQSQFHIEFSVWVHESQMRLARRIRVEDLS